MANDAPTWEETTEEQSPRWEDTTEEAPPAPAKQVITPPLTYVGSPTFGGPRTMVGYPTPEQLGAFQPLAPIPRIRGKSLIGQIAAAPVNVGAGFVESLESPVGGPLAAVLPVTGRLGGVAAGLGFGIPAVKAGLEDVYKGTALGEPQQAIEGALNTLAGGGMISGAIPRRIEAPPAPVFIPEGRPAGIPGRRMVVAPPGMATLEQAQAFTEAGQPIRRSFEEVRVPPEAPEGQPTYPPSGLGRPTTEPRPEPTIAVPPAEPPAPTRPPPKFSPEIAKLGPAEAGGEDMLGNPLGTQYYATPEDWAKWQQIQAGKAAARQAGHPAAMALAFAQNEVLKNKYGGNVPLPPKGMPAESMVTLYHGEGGPGGAGVDTRFFTKDPVQAARYGPNVTEVQVPKSVADAAEAARQAQGIGTPGAILPQEWVKKAKPMAKPPEAPVTEISEAPAKLTAAAYLPEGATAPETGPNHPSILKRIGVPGFETAESRNTPQFGFVDENGVFHTREESAEIAKVTGQDLKQFEPGEPAYSGEIESPTKPGTPISEEPAKGLISGSDVEKWADQVIKTAAQRLRSGLDPELAAAGVVKGAAILERGITEFAKWSAEMVREFGEAIKPHLANLFEQAKSLRAQAFERKPSAAPAARAVTPPATEGPQPPPSPPAPAVQPGAAAAPIESVHGIAARVSEAAAKAGIIAPVEPGEGIAAAESVEHGRDLLSKGANAQGVLDEFNRTKAVTADGMAVVRAQGERLRKAAYAAADRFGTKSKEYEAAWKADSDWTAAIKPMQTEWHKIGQAQQGEVEIDTGTFHGLRSAFFEATGKDFTPDQKTAAERIAKGVKQATDEADQAKDTAFKKIAAEVPQAEPTPAPKPRRKGEPPIAKPMPQRVWQRARAIIDAGETDFDDVRHKLAIEFGIPVEEVTRIMAEPKSIRMVTDEMYDKMAVRRNAVRQAKNWLKNQQMPGWERSIKQVPRIFFLDKTAWHSTVGMITHAGLNIFNPFAWETYWPNFLRQFKLALNKGYHERMMQDLVRDPLFTKARRAGLVNEPFRYQDDYQTPEIEKWLGRFGLGQNRGFDSLKLFRQARFNQIWNDELPANRTPLRAKMIADEVNHASGVVKTGFGGEWANWTFFAPKLEGSRWAWMIGDPLKAAKTFLGWADATPEARSSALGQLKEKAAIAGTYYSLLALNQGILSATGSKDKINFTNPRRSDFMTFKVAGHNIGIVSPMLGMVRLFANLVHASIGKRGKLESLQSRADEMGSTVSAYARGKLSPFAGFGVDLTSQADFQGRPLPFSSDRVPAYLRKQGIKKYGYWEYGFQEFTPIPMSEAIREVWRAQGMKEDEMTRYLDALLVGVVAGGTGARVSVETPAQKAK